MTRSRQQRLRARHALQGKCTECTRRAQPDRSRCARHLWLQRVHYAERRMVASLAEATL
jgi:hypothetical protein